ncbi:intermembrane phospholipid transport protein YdbH family protein [Mariprofundus ferrooxydans]|uniref:intermembrane phospholipid transport protein YdbH family protein n=1 Tax=Mariprofundus ferrooxydans TaxID=314344 RepID=UPI0014311C93|nr:YdbH domain-containing protein [Mariprofundus ferrooxydans]
MPLKRTTLWLIAFVLLMAVTYISLPQLLSMLISARLADAGYSNNQLHIASLNLKRARIDTAQLRSDDGSLQISMQGLSVDYSLTGLLSGHLRRIELAGLSLAIKPASAPAQGVSISAPAAMLALIPAEELRVDLIHIDFPPDQPLRQITGQLDYGHGTLKAPLVLDNGREQFHLQAEMKQDGSLRIALEQPGQEAVAEIASIRGIVSDQQGKLHFAGTLHADYALLWPLAGAWLPGEKVGGQLDAELKLAWPELLPSNRLALFSSLAGEVRVSTRLTAEQWGSAKQVDLNGTLRLTVADGHCEWWVARGLKLAAQWPDTSGSPSLSLPAGLHGSVVRDENRLLLTLAPQQTLRLGKLQFSGLKLPDTEINVDQPLQLSYATASGWQPENVDLSVAKQILQWNDLRITHQGSSLRLDSGRTWQLRMSGVTLAAAAVALRVADLDLYLSYEQGVISSRFSLVSKDGLLQLSGQAQQQLQTGSGSLTWSVPEIAFGESHRLSSWLKMQSDIDLDGGALSLSGSSDWRRSGTAYRFNHHIDAVLQSLSGNVGESRFSGLSTHLQLAGGERLSNRSPATITLTLLDNGVAIRNLTLKLGLELPLSGRKPVVHVDNASAELLGGKVAGSGITLDFNRRKNPFNLSVTHLDIEQILALERQQGLYGSGLLDGTIPMISTPDGMTVVQGYLSARAPGGVIRYVANDTAQALAKSNSKMDMVLGIFHDFHYDQMNVTTDYAANGQLMMQVHLAGRNPAYAAGRAVAFNLSLEENVLQLLKSLRVDSNVSKNIDKRMQQRLKR